MRKFLTLLLLFSLIACQSESQDSLAKLELKSPSGEIIKTRLVYTPEKMQQGLSGIKPDQFREDEGMLFFYLQEQEMHFWMPDTYFDLDLIYLDKDLKITEIIRKLPHYIGRANPDMIPRTRGVWSRHVLEMKATSPLSQKLKVGDSLTWSASIEMNDAEERIKKELQKNQI